MSTINYIKIFHMSEKFIDETAYAFQKVEIALELLMKFDCKTVKM